MIDTGETSEGDDPDGFAVEDVEPDGAVHKAVVALQGCFLDRKLPVAGKRLWIKLQRICRHELDDRKRVDEASDVTLALIDWAESQRDGGRTHHECLTVNGGADSGESPTKPQPPVQTSPRGFFGGSDLIAELDIDPKKEQAFMNQLTRKRNSLGDDVWIESENRRPNTPTFLYKASDPAILKIAKRYKRDDSA
ncbi:hypothetical protein NG895_28960 [Aeoliella sp. ICT_H6.2]|uniref:Uncharacterized protein n=1 Tax=Aeoliella straminimaris TaxID=2954799 RepID=A0A9X2JKA8_9BACT|nr:hypothetical protein [Aeoliella straminimaris]MCO6047953.1 hypothetical protein [Aeoliella straminimaris]